MDSGAAGLHTLTCREQYALQSLLVRATADGGGSGDRGVLELLVAAAPMSALPAAAALHRVGGTVHRRLNAHVPDVS
jgi:hypothetical protein